MNDLIFRETQTVSSMEVAEWAEKEHFHLMRDIEGYIENLSKLGESKVGLSDKINVLEYFVEGTYESGTRSYRMYEITKKAAS